MLGKLCKTVNLFSMLLFHFSVCLDTYSDMVRLVVSDFHFENDNLTIRVQSSKTDFLRAGADVFIAANTEKVSCCPVRTSRAYFQKLKAIGFTGNDTPVLVDTGKRSKEKTVSAAALLKRMRDSLSNLVADTTLYSLHSFRSGGATAAAQASVPRHLIAMHGRWQSNCVNRYIKENKETRFSVSRSIAKS